LTSAVLYAAADIISRLLGGRSEYAPSFMYLEFTNGSFTPPAIDQTSDGRAYYASLTNVTPSDYLRIPLTGAPAFSAADANHVANIATFLAMTASGAGINGQAFSDGSKLVGGALVSSPTGIISADVVYSRFYYAADAQITKVAGQQIGIAWPTTFT
jgi:hypothetical protein